jgi:hypothetical protein
VSLPALSVRIERIGRIGESVKVFAFKNSTSAPQRNTLKRGAPAIQRHNARLIQLVLKMGF